MPMKRAEFIVGIDEVGRGSLAGPLYVAAVAIPRGLRIRNSKLGKLKDSKRLTKLQREAWCAYFEKHPGIFSALSQISSSVIDRMNVTKAANLAALRACKKLTAHLPSKKKPSRVYLDGNLFLGNGENMSFSSKTVVRGDEKYVSIKAASVIAKVHRDRLMERFSKRYPAYGFETNKGYGTEIHRRAVRKYGATTMHRLTFLENFSNI